MRESVLVSSLLSLALLVAVGSVADSSAPGPSPAATSPAGADQPAASAPPVEIYGDAAGLAGLGSEEITPVPVKKGPPNQESCPGEFDISRPSSFYDCTLEVCHQWCVEEGGSYASAYAWILPASGGLCLCKCCP